MIGHDTNTQVPESYGGEPYAGTKPSATWCYFNPHKAAAEIKKLQDAARDALEFMEKIEGHGYGGMANFEVARQSLRDVVD